MEMSYIPDEPINLFENDLLATSAYVEALEEILKDCPTPYTIGIFGSWGSGKSSILKTIQHKYNTGNKKEIMFFIYDAWKYSKDDFRRSFILELCNFMMLKKEKEKIFEALYGTTSTTKEFGIAKIITYKTSQSTTFTPIIQPELFEEKFKDILNILKNNGCNKFIIAIDNIDRCHKEQAFEILLTVKNFLELEGVIFLIPIDEKGLRKYLQMSHQDANEFLRKLFNTHIQIRSFSDNELFDYGIKLIEKYGIKLPQKETVISLISQEYSKNPRRIIQFLNTLQTEYYLAQIQERKGYIPQGAITKNIDMLVKLLIIREEYPEIYEITQDDKNLIKEISEAILTQSLSSF
ncbi:hypothetical protein A45J_2546 [hot springs metagenome]|uniref:KAP NTPase domain-containing protein n=1 Tax=hot springs metagenome TaxID=433727 RepID=A0A5J4L7D0_9ZZZZ